MLMLHLASQQNDAIESTEDCRQKYLACCLFRKITHEHPLCQHDSGPFKLFYEDLCPVNVLTNGTHRMTGVVDWGFTYTASPGFAYSPPFWLRLKLPEHWDAGLDDWTEWYDQVLPTFLKVLDEREQAAIARGSLTETDRLSKHMRDSWHNGDFWVNYAARKSCRAFDLGLLGENRWEVLWGGRSSERSNAAVDPE